MKIDHFLKIDKLYMRSKIEGSKYFEVRLNDRGFSVGDKVQYTCSETGKAWPQVYEITFITDYEQCEDYVVYGEKEVEQVNTAPTPNDRQKYTMDLGFIDYSTLRNTFERAAKKKGYCLKCGEMGRYIDNWLQEAWEIFALMDFKALENIVKISGKYATLKPNLKDRVDVFLFQPLTKKGDL